jgi:protein subunit release factor A
MNIATIGTIGGALLKFETDGARGVSRVPGTEVCAGMTKSSDLLAQVLPEVLGINGGARWSYVSNSTSGTRE